MRAITYYIAVSIDGFIADPGGSFATFPAVGPHLDHIAAEYPETLPTAARPHFGITDAPSRHFDTVVMGRGTYQPALDAGIASPYAHLRQFVVSSSVPAIDHPAVTLVRSDPLGLVRRLKAEDGQGIWLAGGGDLAGQLLPEIDRLVVKSYPLVLGAGIPMFRTGLDVTAFRRVDGLTTDNGVTFTTHHRER